MTTDADRLRRTRVALYGPMVTGLFGCLLIVGGAIGISHDNHALPRNPSRSAPAPAHARLLRPNETVAPARELDASGLPVERRETIVFRWTGSSRG